MPLMTQPKVATIAPDIPTVSNFTSDNFCKFLLGVPLVQFNNLFLNQGQGRIAAADAESADLQKAD